MKLPIKLFALFGLFASSSLLAEHCLYQCPAGKAGQVLQRSIYTLHNNPQTKLADWVAYKVTASTIDGPSRRRYWKADPDLAPEHTLETGDYKDAHAVLGTDRGHQVPLASFSNTPDWAQTNYLSNITPQSSALNQGPWVRLESAVRDLARTGQDVYVVSGPLYESFFGELPGADEEHSVPSGYFKVVMTNPVQGLQASAFVLHQNASRQDSFCYAQVTVDEVETRSGLNLLPTLPPELEAAVEGQLGSLSRLLGC
ncbi:DNA/RNA non-specific endonuclease [Bowmanella dokdonensis]|uniref:Endonuclease n=1 Tax=Bowmanella dokdonensis TaxID=751969 RepID=A0A939DJZ8_9ALTE|nr:DNA/RNA non-specific endonuclease [Bowmanella dokdonensis]MBN7824047.1 DNA/RNA non-specific endonuclease [Bowmanella dokdonensis]